MTIVAAAASAHRGRLGDSMNASMMIVLWTGDSCKYTQKEGDAVLGRHRSEAADWAPFMFVFGVYVGDFP